MSEYNCEECGREIKPNEAIYIARDSWKFWCTECAEKQIPSKLTERDKMICPKCNKDLIVDDEDYQFKGCFDQYLICKNPNCHIHGFRKVRYKKCILEELSEYDENTDTSKIIYSRNPSKMDGSEFGGNNECK